FIPVDGLAVAPRPTGHRTNIPKMFLNLNSTETCRKTFLAQQFKATSVQRHIRWDRNVTATAIPEHFGEVDGQKQGLVKPTATRHLLFIRHGQYVKAEEDEKKVLTSLGRQQAGETANRLKMLHSNNNKIDKIVVSSMVRARETGEIIRNQLSGVPYEYCDFLTEGAPCIPEPPSSSYKPESYLSIRRALEESARIEAAFRKYIHRAELEQKTDSTEVYVGHANVIRYFVCRALQFPPEGWLRMSIDNCGITRLTIKPNGHVSLQSMGDTGHLHPKLITRN
ncbi:Hypothetical predicted protein, partial [Paramuricea clavata]